METDKKKWLARLKEIEDTPHKNGVWITTNELVELVDWAKLIFEK